MIYKSAMALKEFCGTRVGEIKRTCEELELTCPVQWLWVPSQENAADTPSRGEVNIKFLESSGWRHGPDFLQEEEENWPTKIHTEFHAPQEEMLSQQICLLTTQVNKKYESESVLYPLAKKCGNIKTG